LELRLRFRRRRRIVRRNHSRNADRSRGKNVVRSGSRNGGTIESGQFESSADHEPVGRSQFQSAAGAGAEPAEFESAAAEYSAEKFQQFESAGEAENAGEQPGLSETAPAEQQRIKRGLENWTRLTPEQQNHIKNNVLPKWRQLPPDRQRAIGSRLNVLQNMPESARNQHLSDPNFTRGMSEDDKSMLRDLAHQHVGGAPEPPNE